MEREILRASQTREKNHRERDVNSVKEIENWNVEKNEMLKNKRRTYK